MVTLADFVESGTDCEYVMKHIGDECSAAREVTGRVMSILV